MSDCVIVGGGIMGLLQARFLAQAGWQVTVCEQGEFGKESSWAGGGILSPLYPWRYPDAITRLALRSQQLYPALAQELIDEGCLDPEYTRSGIVILDPDERDAALTWAQHWSIPCEHIQIEKLRALVPGLGANFTKALWFPSLAQIRNPRLMKSLQASCQQAGITLLSNTPVIGLINKNSECRGVQTPTGTINAKIVIICSGAWSARVLENYAQVPIRPVKGQMLMLKGAPNQLTPIVMYQDHYLIPRRDGRILVGSTLEEAGFDKTTTDAARDTLHKIVQSLIPSLENLPIERHWAGLRPGSPNGIPYICKIPGISGLYMNSGHYRNGVVLGLASAQLLTNILLGSVSDLDPTPYQLI